jgi:hypothetical protein
MKMKIPLLEEVIEALRRFPQGSEVSPTAYVVYTKRSYQGECCFDVFAEELPDFSKPDACVTPERAAQIIDQAQAKAVHGPWSDQIGKVITRQENQEILDKWETMPGNTCYVDALLRLKNGE